MKYKQGGSYAFTACAAATWIEAIRDTDATKPSPPPRNLVNVGANKGYVIAQFLAAFAPHLGHTPQTLHQYLLSVPAIAEINKVNQRWACGTCDDCREEVTSGPADLGLRRKLRVHAIEPVELTLDLIRGWQREARIPTDLLTTHLKAVSIKDGGRNHSRHIY
jgi:hypothetical protein